jgi:hypothetical protein
MILEELKKNELDEIFDKKAKDIIKFLLNRTLICYPEFLKEQTEKSIYLEKKQCEQWIVQSLGLVPVGEGSYPIDGISKNKIGYDISNLNWGITKGNKEKKETGEKSLAQKFADENFGDDLENLDELFTKGKKNEILIAWKEILKNKWNETIKEKSLKKIILINIIKRQDKNKFYIFGIKINVKNIDNCEVDFSKKSKDSVFINNFINEELGSVKIYKAKKRLELRLKPKKWLENGDFIEFNFIFNNKTKNLRDEFTSNKKGFLKEIKKDFEKFIKESSN